VIGEHPEFIVTHQTKLDDTEFIMRQRLYNSLQNDEWDFDTYPNPYVAILDIVPKDKILESRFPVDVTCEDGYQPASGLFEMAIGWNDGKHALHVMHWPGIPTWLDIIDALITLSKEKKWPFDYMLISLLLTQGSTGKCMVYRIPPVIHEFAYERFKASFTPTLEDLYKDDKWSSWKCRCGCLNGRSNGNCGRCGGNIGLDAMFYGADNYVAHYGIWPETNS
jgi:hypothetical protein